MENGSVNALKFVNCFIFKLCHFKIFDDYVTLSMLLMLVINIALSASIVLFIIM